MVDLSILIPARNEIFLARTIQDVLEHAHGSTDVIAVLDGEWADPPVDDNERVTLIYNSTPVGQRGATNQAARVSTAKYIMKIDAHTALADGFDVQLLSDIQDGWTMSPTMRNLHAFDWVCPDGHRRYQGPEGPCEECGKPTTMDVVWIAKRSPSSSSFCFDPEPHFQYFNSYRKRPEARGQITESMSLQGSCFMMSRDQYFELDMCDETFGIWGSLGIEVAAKTWLSGRRVMIDQNTWYAHMFRTRDGFSFPYNLPGHQVEHAKEKSRELFFQGKWEKAVHPVSWLVEKFWPVDHWKDEDLQRLKDAEQGNNLLH